jgi:predicted nucleic acid-binding protein
MARRRAKRPPAQRLILDSGAVIALARQDARARAALTATWEVGADVIVPAVVVAETVRGDARDAPVNRILNAVGNVAPATEAAARTAGALLARANSAATIDALVVAEAVHRGGGVVLTGDAADLGSLAAPHAEVVIQSL